ncbi:diiron oxygenase [Nocardia puris]|uniref:Para-aminobenzoate N-oxygenase AurF n=1 Tax=Nocardia puris TaxID=208602 RepID=A0A366DVT4_9NOCA|nr:diiron oxygenase [Nocardia puris]MBF6210041.1 diiron oxygenase [Nocardia puris]MBF6368232.1 diiron oxygenase [Nocardia puris]MBF6458049.1 diiron oxygenase [Nocardia puris]RBO94211.1 para-aminobenzoate N-oxygenase AurF [Nocardia puris]
MTLDASTPPIVTTAGASTARRRTVGDRQKTAQRLLRSTAERAYDGELDIDWSAPPDPHRKWMPEHRQSLYGTALWDRLTQEQRDELGKHEAVSVLSFGIYAEAGLSLVLWRSVLESGDPSDDHTRYALAEIGEETRHSTMFSRLVNLTGVRPYVQPRWTRTALRLAGLIPIGPSSYAGTLLIEELLDRLQREAMNDPELQPHLRQLMKIHVLEEARHITYAREEMVRAIEARGKLSNALHRMVFGVMITGVYPVLINPNVYRSVGISPWRGFLAMMTSPNYRANATFAAEPLLRFCHEAGFLDGVVTRRLARASRAVPDDILDDLFGRKAARS